jgi:hypothetical protein
MLINGADSQPRCVRMEPRIDSRAELFIGPQLVKTLRLDWTQVAAIRPCAVRWHHALKYPTRN